MRINNNYFIFKYLQGTFNGFVSFAGIFDENERKDKDSPSGEFQRIVISQRLYERQHLLGHVGASIHRSVGPARIFTTDRLIGAAS